MGLIIQYEDGQTPLDEEEKEGLLIASVTTRSELDEAEQQNIEEAVRWTIERRKRFTAIEILTEEFVCHLHRRMFSNVWTWAGSFRNTDKKIGVDKYQIPTQLRMLIGDCKYWLESKTYPPDEIAVRFKHRLVSIHSFANGNGRHSRLMGDIIVEKIFGNDVFSWGGNSLYRSGGFRSQYLYALREADKGNIEALIKFSRS